MVLQNVFHMLSRKRPKPMFTLRSELTRRSGLEYKGHMWAANFEASVIHFLGSRFRFTWDHYFGGKMPNLLNLLATNALVACRRLVRVLAPQGTQRKCGASVNQTLVKTPPLRVLFASEEAPWILVYHLRKISSRLHFQRHFNRAELDGYTFIFSTSFPALGDPSRQWFSWKYHFSALLISCRFRCRC